MIVFAILWFVLKVKDVAMFQTVWFSYSIVSNLFGLHIIRTTKLPFVQSHASKPVYISSILIMLAGLLVPFTALGALIGLVPITAVEIGFIFAVSLLYCVVTIFAKKIYIKKYEEWI